MFTAFVACALFGGLYPLCWLLFYLHTLLQLRFDRHRYLRVFRRPQQRYDLDLTLWSKVITFAAFVAVATNCYVLAFFRNWYASGNPQLSAGQFLLSFVFSLLCIAVVALFHSAQDKKLRVVQGRQRFAEEQMLVQKRKKRPQTSQLHRVESRVSPMGEVDVESLRETREQKRRKMLGDQTVL